MTWNKQNLSSTPIANDTPKIFFDKTEKSTDSISKHFSQFLKPELALNQTLREEAFKIRHHVYCEELAFEKTQQNGQESDEFDNRSLFTLIKHKPSNTFTSCIRVVTTSSADELLPIEKYCMDSITNEKFNPQRFNRKSIAEISRLAVKPDFRRRKADNFTGSATGSISELTYSETELRCFPFIAISLYMSAAILCKATGVSHIYVMMEPRLARSMTFIGITFQQLGEPVDYHGLRAPYYIKPETFINDLSPNFRGLFNLIENDLYSQLPPLNLI